MVPVESEEVYLIEIEESVEGCIEIIGKWEEANHVLREIGTSFLVHHESMEACLFKCFEEEHSFNSNEQDAEKTKYNRHDSHRVAPSISIVP